MGEPGEDLQDTNEKDANKTNPARYRKFEAPNKRDWKQDDTKVDGDVDYVSSHKPSAIVKAPPAG